jgi:hypothetical protein
LQTLNLNRFHFTKDPLYHQHKVHHKQVGLVALYRLPTIEELYGQTSGSVDVYGFVKDDYYPMGTLRVHFRIPWTWHPQDDDGFWMVCSTDVDWFLGRWLLYPMGSLGFHLHTPSTWCSQVLSVFLTLAPLGVFVGKSKTTDAHLPISLSG